MDLEIKDVADLLQASESTIRRWIVEGKIPAYRINQQFRFSRSEIEDWVMQKRKNEENLFSTTAGFQEGTGTDVVSTGNQQFSLFRAINKGNVFQSIPGKTKDEVIANATKKIASGMNLDSDVLTDLLLDREHLQPTALNHGIGIPHTRDFLLSSHHDIVTVVFPENPVEYGALDNIPVHTLFFLFACDDKRHLHLLAKIAHFSSQPATWKFLQSRPNKEAFLEYVKTWESQIKS
jgi:PTS system nitrogen regulatory IIA component